MVTETEDLPPPVRGYFQRALRDGQQRVARARVVHRGSFLVRPPQGWRPFRATQLFSTRPPGFHWEARIRLLPGLGIRVHDAFVDGAGSMRASLLGLFRLASSAGTPEMAAGALQRYLAEAVLQPTALLPCEGVRWTPVDERSARASLTVGSTTVSLQFRFGEGGLVESVFAPDRPRDVRGHGVPTPWQGRWWEYEERDGMRIPRSGEVEWLLPEGPQVYWRGHVTEVFYEYF